MNLLDTTSAGSSTMLALFSAAPTTARAAVTLTSSFVLGRGRRGGASPRLTSLFSRRCAKMTGSGSVGVRAVAPKLENAVELIDSVETFIFDCDGVIWKGDSLIDGVPETLDMLRSKGKRLVFVTNNSTKSRKQYGKKFETLGLSVGEEEIFASSFAAAAYLKSIDFPKDKKVYVIGEDGILKELELAGFQHLGGPVHSAMLL